MRIPFLTRDREADTQPDFVDDGVVTLRRDVGESSAFQEQVSNFWSSLSGFGNNPRLIENVWSANRCIQLNSQQIAAMPLRFFGSYEPAWVSSPDPNWFPNGIGDAVFAAVRSMYGWGDAFLYVTSRYADGYPSGWTVLDPEPVSVRSVNGKREYRVRNVILDPADVLQISRNPTGALRGTSALQAYGATMVSAVASSDVSRAINNSGIPNAVLKSQRKLTQDQAEALQTQWAARASLSRGLPAVLPPEIDFEQLAFSPKDMMLLDLQEYDARVIASAFGVPPVLINVPPEAGLTYNNPEQLFEIWWRTELRPAAARVSAALSAQWLKGGNWVEFDADDILAPSFADQIAAWEKIIAFGGATVEEFRAAVLRLPPQPLDQSIHDQLVPPVAATSGVQPESSTVVPLRPTTEVSI